ncbi:hypothetical protein NQ317_009254 [Molorchus minor]|uniref:Uncharacterized protein n=1 Tax=Molorchus minor TaxID=1323400 RepID=A0ABQ9JBZ7_9CUCU|nr:hypothetical protein NQ317_009254 [Molorchus minor]
MYLPGIITTKTSCRKCTGKRYAYKFDFHGLMIACQAQAQGQGDVIARLPQIPTPPKRTRGQLCTPRVMPRIPGYPVYYRHLLNIPSLGFSHLQATGRTHLARLTPEGHRLIRKFLDLRKNRLCLTKVDIQCGPGWSTPLLFATTLTVLVILRFRITVSVEFGTHGRWYK